MNCGVCAFFEQTMPAYVRWEGRQEDERVDHPASGNCTFPLPWVVGNLYVNTEQGTKCRSFERREDK